MTTWNLLFLKKCLHVGPNWIVWRLGTLYFKIMLTCGTKVFYDAADMAKALTYGTLKILWRLGTLYFWKKCLHVGPYWILWRLGTLCFKIMHTCGVDVGLWRFFRAYGVTKQHETGSLWRRKKFGRVRPFGSARVGRWGVGFVGCHSHSSRLAWFARPRFVCLV
jgi:hypothetical protein